MAIPLLDAIDLQGKDITADALLTQRKLADYLCIEREAHYHFTVKHVGELGLLSPIWCPLVEFPWVAPKSGLPPTINLLRRSVDEPVRYPKGRRARRFF